MFVPNFRILHTQDGPARENG